MAPTGKRKSPPPPAVERESKGRKIDHSSICPDCKQSTTTAIRVSFEKPEDEYTIDEMTVIDTFKPEDGEPLEFKIDNFRIYHEKCRHLCPIEAFDEDGKKPKTLCMAGYANSIIPDDNKEWLAVKDIKVCSPWNFCDDGCKPLIGVCSAIAQDSADPITYYFGEPADCYQESFLPYKKRTYLLKEVKTLLTTDPDLSYKNLLEQLNDVEVPDDIEILSEDALRINAHFLLAHLNDLDLEKDDEELAFCDTRFVRELQQDVSGLVNQRNIIRQKGIPGRILKGKDQNVHAVTTPIIEDVLKDSLFTGTIRLGGKLTKTKNNDSVDEDNFSDAENDGSDFEDNVSMAKLKIKKKYNNNEDISNFDWSILSQLTFANKLLNHQSNGSWSIVDKPDTILKGQKIHHSIMINRKIWKAGDFAIVDYVMPTTNTSAKKCRIKAINCRIQYFFETDDHQRFMAHVSWLREMQTTILGDVANENEFCFTGDCSDINICQLRLNKKMTFYDVPDNWNMLGGEDDKKSIPKGCFVRHWFNEASWRFYYPELKSDPTDPTFCQNCRSRVKMLEIPLLNNISSKNKTLVSELKWNGSLLKIGSDVLLDVDAYKFDYQPAMISKTSAIEPTNEDYDTHMYPEKCRKTGSIKGSNEVTPKPFKVGRVVEMSIGTKKLKQPDMASITLKVRKFYRPEDIGGIATLDAYSSRKLYWTEEFADVTLDEVQGFCLVTSSLDCKVRNLTLDEYLEGGTNRFYFNEVFNAANGAKPVERISQTVSKSKPKNGKKSFVNDSQQSFDDCLITDNYPQIKEPLKSMDLFAGCGGLSRGLHQSGVAETRWAVELDSPAAKAFALNFPHATIFETDVNIILDAIKAGKETIGDNKQKLPKAGEVELLCGGPPCQGFSGMNRFTSGEYSKFKNSLVVTFLGFVDVLRPKFVIMENVRTFLTFKQSMVLKLTLRTLQRLGYQCTFGCLQAGSYGVPQTRHRAFIFAAAPDQILPSFPLPTHCFSKKAIKLSFNINGQRYELPKQFTCGSGPFSTVTVRDGVSDLPPIKSQEENMGGLVYATEPTSFFQKQMRVGCSKNAVLRNHITKNMSPPDRSSQLDIIRIKYTPKREGSDWRDLPNIIVHHEYIDKNGNVCSLDTEILEYKYGRVENGKKRGVCPCNDGKGQACKIKELQKMTIIPVCLPHTADKHNHWAGLYGRIEWNGFFSTVVTNPHPMGKQGRVVHPEDNRVVSVLEHARAQGFPDCHQYSGSIMEKYRQVGNAVPPPLAFAVGMKFKECVARKQAILKVD